ncbi:acyl-CoA reductase [Algoriphagus namhaensis]
MTLAQRLAAFDQLRTTILNLPEEEAQALFAAAKNKNNWFTTESCQSALHGIAHMLDPHSLKNWLANYDIPDALSQKSVGLMLAGNIPAVGFHDLLCTLLSGKKASVKLSSSDSILMSWIIQKLKEAEPEMEDQIQVEEMLKGKDAYIATGSDNSSRYFDYYFGKYPHIIRKNRTSVAVLTGDEQVLDLGNLGKDIFTYFGLGCRNVSKLFVKEGADLVGLLDALAGYESVADHHKYFNNYEYNKSIYLVNQTPHLDSGFVLLKEDAALVSPIAVLYYEYYRDAQDLQRKLISQEEKIQCVVGTEDGFIPFGQAQKPAVTDYADGVDTMKFLLQL